MDYIHRQAVDGGTILAEAWGTDKLVDDSMIAGMTNVRIPTINATIAGGLGARLLSTYNTWCVRVCVCVCVLCMCECASACLSVHEPECACWRGCAVADSSAARAGFPCMRGKARSTSASLLKFTTI
jgi:hypothetical protein